jgi:Nicotianamine synthase protein
MSLSNSALLCGLSQTPPSTPVSAAFSPATLEEQDETAAYIKYLLGCYSVISSFPDLQPSPQVNEAFERLVALCIQVKDESVIKKVCFLSSFKPPKRIPKTDQI